MHFDWNNGSLAAGLRCYHAQEFFAAHEHWEAVWLQAPEPEKTFLQGIIQIAAAFHHLQRANPQGTAQLLEAALRRLEQYPSVFQRVSVEPLRRQVRAWLEALQSPGVPPALPFPAIEVGNE